MAEKKRKKKKKKKKNEHRQNYIASPTGIANYIGGGKSPVHRTGRQHLCTHTSETQLTHTKGCEPRRKESSPAVRQGSDQGLALLSLVPKPTSLE